MNSMQQQCQRQLELERDAIVARLQAVETGNKEPDLDPLSIKVQRLKLISIESTLGRIRNGRFGVCQECQHPIAYERLLALPTAGYCIECQRQRERIAAIRSPRRSLGRAS